MDDDRWLGAELAGYRIEALIGRGGAGVVYRATQLRLQRPAAVKLLAPGLATDAEYRQRFEREARLAAALEHPHIVPVYDSGFADGVLYLTMRYIDGPNLATAVRDNGPMDLQQTCDLLTGIAEALDSAHHAGLVHRDVKPGNVLIAAANQSTGRKHAYLCDFGIARHVVSDSTLTTTGQFLGTVSYCAPEQLQRQAVDGCTDQYALACVAYYCLTGRAPFTGGDPAAVMFAHITAAPTPASAHNPDLPPAVDDVLARALAKHPTDRFDNCTTFIHALAAATGPGAPPRELLPGHPGPAGDPTETALPDDAATSQIQPPQVRQKTRSRGLRALLLLAIPALAAIVAAATLWVPPAATNSSPTPPATAQATPPTSTAPPVPIRDPKQADPCALMSTEQLSGFGKVAAGPAIAVFFGRCVIVLSLSAGGTARIHASFIALNGRKTDARTEHGLPIFHGDASRPGCLRSIVLSDQHIVSVAVEVSGGSADACAIADLVTTHAVKDLIERGVQYLHPASEDINSLRHQNACTLLDDQTLRRVPTLDPTRRFEGMGNWGCLWGNSQDDAEFHPPGVALDFLWTNRGAVREGERKIQLGGRDAFIGYRNKRNGHTTCQVAIVHRSRPFSTGAPAHEIVRIEIYDSLPEAEKCALAEEFASVVVSKLPPP